jgi:predicted metalloprotease with PDZ domain
MILPQSPADISGFMLEDEIIAVNNVLLGGELDKWLNYFKGSSITITVQRAGKLVNIDVNPGESPIGYKEYRVKPLQELNEQQKMLFNTWIK